MAMKVYELRENAGPHRLRGEDANGNMIDHAMQPGQQVKSEKPLNRLFPNKFDCVDDLRAQQAKKAKRGPLTEPVRPASNVKRAVDPEDEDDSEYTPPDLYDPDVDHDTDNDEAEGEEGRRKTSKAARKLTIKKGAKEAHTKEERRKAKKGEAEPLDDSALAEEADDEQEVETDVEQFGEDVTEDVEGATEKDLKVFFKDKHYSVYDADDLTTPRTEKPLTKAKLAKFVEDYQG